MEATILDCTTGAPTHIQAITNLSQQTSHVCYSTGKVICCKPSHSTDDHL
jgi:hypothetical protein